ncbi:peptide chain release factor 2 [Candidatus Wolfebacteria bacterium CG18_big_fil_WC_8_21_14_2_50_39_7]|uniref:Peptide chain release factor 2 n=2 Tax=Candidatus Wolfeibacteriota TaxID=1752735 RepID=A0A2M7Q676_9BACT|nr:PCRF domain-containing protein [Parcubacteria group bacterium]NCO89377.1 PCRF domain-containing protein [Candidatus Wolfebacteria bacterium]PIP92168.1 MAG: peptide chain release factor 2 [Candidatus Wolfebacteria bacterium CG18_big_fil_WC_8_21_14_2_50_39_7]PIY58941.1 MAG: peptide chain release factor 2 [Candidatus Wolfebacteria bacterium CG_4_10_14_0_8_um_filter_39_64]NCP58394.1 PCRF domain-containing protein [Candidatus Wolfebacteria bacterium]
MWKNREIADAKIKETGELNDLIKRFNETEELLDKTENLELAENKLRQLEIERLFTGKYDKQSAIISIYAGAGGDDAEDWAAMLFEMYSKFCEKRGWKTKVINESLADFQSKTGRHPVKNVTFEIKGDYSYGYLKKEAGVHRLVRISPFSPEKKRHTSFALVEVLPELSGLSTKEGEDELKIPAEDLKIEFFRSSGPGGQNVNKVETAVRIVHLPTGLTAASQVERSQVQNRERAMKLLQAKLLKLMEDTQIKELDKLRVKVKPEWGSQIRSYVLHPYKLVKDHRTGVETSRAEEVLEGNLDLFIESEVK